MRLIDADALLEDDTTVIQEYFDGYCKFGYSRKQIEEAPTIDPVKHGRWIKHKDGYYRCSECGARGSAIKAHYCHHCGSRNYGTRGEEDE